MEHPDSPHQSSNPEEGLESVISQRKRLEDYRDKVKSFIGSPMHTMFVSNTTRLVDNIEKRIVEDEITSLQDIIELIDFRGQRRVLRADLTTFEDTAANLDARIKELLERETETQQKENQE